MDESGVQTVPNKLPKHVAPTGKRDVSKNIAAKHGPTVTAVCAMSAVGHYVPPLFIYSRLDLLLIKVSPVGCSMSGRYSWEVLTRAQGSGYLRRHTPVPSFLGGQGPVGQGFKVGFRCEAFLEGHDGKFLRAAVVRG
ncbi:hypothetical protein GE061_005393 [Apolygus lucorum]|uniref:Uncharacterized protein n=1 Tax=Apolygus lucorum TaxID=248454 RepID=A0A8S9WYS0_APOLU|nr:hypothetical protein GE061_005393 [Apolygus lucorum]